MAMSRWFFVCKNEKCEHKDKGFIFMCPWPLGNIDEVINSKPVSKNAEFKEQLEKIKSQGRTYACIQYPDVDSIRPIGYRVHLWCDKCASLSEFDIMISEEDKKLMIDNNLCANESDVVKRTIANANLPKQCPTCNSRLVNHDEIHKKINITCPTCKTKSMPVPNIWFANEKPVR